MTTGGVGDRGEGALPVAGSCEHGEVGDEASVGEPDWP